MKGKRKQGREKKGARGNSTCPLKSFAASMLAPLSPLHSTCSRLVPFFFVATRASNLDYPASPRFGFAKSTDIVRFINTPPFRWIASEIFRLCVLIKKKKRKGKRDIEFFIRALGRKVALEQLFFFSLFPNFHSIFIYLSSVGSFLLGVPRGISIDRFHCSFLAAFLLFESRFFYASNYFRSVII